MLLMGYTEAPEGWWREFVLATPARTGKLAVTRKDGSPQGIIYTRQLDLVVMNGGQGDLPTEEGLAQAVAALAHVVAANDAKTPDRFFSDLLPHTERLHRFASADGPSADGKLR